MKIRLPIISVGLVVAAVVVHVLPGAAGALQYDRTALARGEVWRLFTAHLAHFSGNHLAWDATVALVLGAA